MPLDKDRILEMAETAVVLTREEQIVLAKFLTSTIGVKIIAEIITMERAVKDEIANCNFTTAEGVATATRAQGRVQGLRSVTDLILTLAEVEEND